MNKSIFIFGMLLFSCLVLPMSINVAKSKDFGEYKKGLEVELKHLKGRELNQVLPLKDAHPLTSYIFGYIRNKYDGRVYVKIQLNLHASSDVIYKYPITFQLPHGKRNYKNYFLVYLGELGPVNGEVSYEILSITIKGSEKIYE